MVNLFYFTIDIEHNLSIPESLRLALTGLGLPGLLPPLPGLPPPPGWIPQSVDR